MTETISFNSLWTFQGAFAIDTPDRYSRLHKHPWLFLINHLIFQSSLSHLLFFFSPSKDLQSSDYFIWCATFSLSLHEKYSFFLFNQTHYPPATTTFILWPLVLKQHPCSHFSPQRTANPAKGAIQNPPAAECISPHLRHSPQSGSILESCMHSLNSHFKNLFLSCLNFMELWSLSSMSFCLQRNKAPYSESSFTIIYFCFPAAVLPEINVLSTKGESVLAFSPLLSHPCKSLTFFQASESHWIRNNCSHSQGAAQNQHLSRHRSHAGTLASARVLSWHTTRAPYCSADCQFTQFELSMQKFSMMQSAR